MYFIGVENGLTRTRSVVLNLESATVVAEAEQAHEMVPGLPAGHREQDPSQWILAVDQTVRSCLVSLGEERRRVAGIGVCGQAQGLVLLDAENRIVRPAKLRDDRSAERQRGEISEAFGGPPGLIELMGHPMGSASVGPRILWLKQHEPHVFRKVATLLMPHDFINYWLTGVKRTEFNEASETGLLDVRNRRWCPELLRFIDPRLEGMLPPLRSSCTPHGQLRVELARGWGLSEDILISAGGAADMMAALGTGCVLPGTVSVSMTGRVDLRGVCGEAVVDPRGEVVAGCDLTDHWVLATRDSRASAYLEQIRTQFGWNAEAVDAALAGTAPGAGGLVYLPGRSAIGRKGVLYGIDRQNMTPSNMARVGTESVALELGAGMIRMRQLGFQPEEVWFDGVGAGLAASRQLLSDVMGLPIMSSRVSAGGAMGAALQAAVTFFHQSGENLSYAEITSYALAPDHLSRCEPDADRHAFYRDLLGRQQALEEIMNGGGVS